MNATPIDDGGPAFPHEPCTRTNYTTESVKTFNGAPGMTLRDYFAGQALAGLCANSELTSHFDSPKACWAYKLADAMLKARKDKP